MRMTVSGHAARASGAWRSGVLPDWRKIRCLSLLALVSLLLAGAGKGTRAQTAAEEYRVKAAFIFHFAQLVDWPPDTQTGTDNSLFLCTLGEDPFQGTLEETV